MSAGVIAAHYVASAPAPVGDFSGAVLADNPLGFYKLNDAPGSGTVTGLGSAGHSVTYEAAATHPTGLLTEYAYCLDSSAGGALGSLSTAPASSATYTVEVWLRWTTLDAGYVWHIRDNVTTNGAKWLRWTGTQLEFGYYSSGTRTNVLTFTPVVGQLYHVVVTVDKGTNLTTWYVNGVSQGSATASTNNVPGDTVGYPLAIGGRNTTGVLGTRFQGRIQGLAWYNTALSAARVSAHYTAAAV